MLGRVAEMTKVLILTTDVYSRIGGGENVYRTLISENPKIDFYFFSSSRYKVASLPKNAFMIPLHPRPLMHTKYKINEYNSNRRHKMDEFLNRHQVRAAELAEQYAQSVNHRYFDLIDVPEYEIVGDYLRSAFERNRVKFEVLTSFIHGALSKTLEFEGKVSKVDIDQLRELEKLQSDQADFFFTLDQWYPNQLAIDPAKCIQLNPWQFITRPIDSAELEEKPSNPRLVFFARWERRKGVDLIPPLMKLVGIKNLGLMLTGISTTNLALRNEVEKSSKNRSIVVETLETSNSVEVYKGITKRDLLIIPSRFDSFNLVALEGLAAGKNVAISKSCGAFHFLRDNHPDIHFVEIDVLDVVSTAKSIEESLKDNQELEFRITQNQKSLDDIFLSVERSEYSVLLNNCLKSKKSQKTHSINGYVFQSPGLKRILITNLTRLSPAVLGRSIRYLKSWAIESYKFKLKTYFKSSLAYSYLQSLKLFQTIILKLHRQRDYIFTKPRNFLLLASSQNFSKVRKLTYATRSLRFEGYTNAVVNANNVIANLEEIGLLEESKALRAILSDSTGIEVFNYLEERRIELRESPAFTFESESPILSAAWTDAPKITIIVSSYNATSKMEVFLQRLSLCPELRDGAAEILLIDANSETPDSDVAVKIADKLGIALRAIRVHRRVTIQEAWNFGIAKANGEFLSFLGVDETIYPSALTELAANLDLDQTVDWVMASSIVTEVGSDGQFIRDVMKYDRSGAGSASPFLETCYISYVAGMYRKNIHERFGYYDPTFRGAGDTEFKSRVLPSLKVSYLDAVLGEFLNYPEVRTTATERIELEDIRAWYVFRTPGGLKYQASLAGDGFLESLGRAALGYRKSYCEHTSTDINIASAVLQATESGEFSISDGLLTELENASRQLKSIRVFLGYGPSKRKSLSFKRYLSLMRWFDIEGRKSAFKGVRRMRLDNMFEQHMWYW